MSSVIVLLPMLTGRRGTFGFLQTGNNPSHWKLIDRLGRADKLSGWIMVGKSVFVLEQKWRTVWSGPIMSKWSGNLPVYPENLRLGTRRGLGGFAVLRPGQIGFCVPLPGYVFVVQGL